MNFFAGKSFVCRTLRREGKLKNAVAHETRVRFGILGVEMNSLNHIRSEYTLKHRSAILITFAHITVTMGLRPALWMFM